MSGDTGLQRAFDSILETVTDHFGLIEDAFVLNGVDPVDQAFRQFQMVGLKHVRWGIGNYYTRTWPSNLAAKLIGMNIASAAAWHPELGCVLAESLLEPETVTSTIVFEGSQEQKRKRLSTEIFFTIRTHFPGVKSILSFGHFEYISSLCEEEGIFYRYIDNSLMPKHPDIDLSDYTPDLCIVSSSTILHSDPLYPFHYVFGEGIPTLVVAQTCPNLIAKILRDRPAIILSQEFPFWYLPGPCRLNTLGANSGKN